MPSQIIVPDSIFDNPVQNDLNPANQSILGGRLMSSAPHTDGLLLAEAGAISWSGTGATKLPVRNAKGDWSLNRTAGGAETHFFRCTLGNMNLIRLGESAILGVFGTGNTYTPPQPDKGLEIIDFFAIYLVGVAALTSATLRVGKTVYSSAIAGGAFTQTDLQSQAVPAGGLTTSGGNYRYVDVPTTTPVFHKDDLGLVEIEFSPVMANTGTLQLAAIGAHVNFNYT